MKGVNLVTAIGAILVIIGAVIECWFLFFYCK